MMTILLYQVLVFIIAIIAIIYISLMYKNKNISFYGFILSIIICFLIIFIGLYPQQTTILAHFFGLKRGLDLIFAFSIAFLMFILFLLKFKLDKQNQELTKLIRKIAIDNEEYLDNEDS